MPRTPPGRLIGIGTHRLHLTCEGSGSPSVVFDAALGASSVSWSLVMPAVARLTRACTYDRAGFGWSEAGPLPRTAGVIAAELRTLLERAGVEPPFLLVGHSFGGLVMRIFATRHRSECAGLVLVDPAHPEEWIQPGEHQLRQIARGVRLCRYGTAAARLGIARAIAGLVRLGALAPARALVRLVSRGGLSRADEEILAPVWKLPPEARRPLSSFWVRREFFEALGSQIESICESAEQARDADLTRLADLPVIVISAASASEMRQRRHEAAARMSRRGRHLMAERGGHWVPLDEPEIIIDAITDLVRQYRGDPP